MPLFRSFSKPTHFSKWFEATPDLSVLLACLGVRNITTPQSLSVFRTTNFMDELGVQAALTQRDTSSAEKKYGLRIDPRDCQAAGIKVHYDRKGETGIRLVDVKHVTLEGNQEQFSQLIGLTIARLWEGTECLCAFPAHQIVGQLAIFRKDERTGIEAKERCCISLSKTQQWFQELEDDDQIEIRGHLEHKPIFPVTAIRSFKRSSSGPWYWRLAGFIRRKFDRK